MAMTDWTALRCLAAVALEQSNQPTASTNEVFDERDVVRNAGGQDTTQCDVCPHFFRFELDLTHWNPGYIFRAMS